MPKVKILIPQPQKFTLTYRKQSGEVKDYIISVPIEKTDTGFTSYAFGHGIRTFLNDRVVALDVK